MTKCTKKPADEFLESYLLGTLPEDEAQTFEEHYFDCPDCLSQVEALQAASRQLHLAPRRGLRPTLAWPYRVAALGAIAALLLIAFVVLHGKRPPQPTMAHSPVTAPPAEPAPSKPAGPASLSVAQLADLALPPFRGANLRGESEDSHFTAGMKNYAERDCAHAVTALSQVPVEDQDSVAARFFSGVCRMHQGDLSGASKSLRAVAEAGDSPQQEAALYYLAQTSLASNDAAAARRYLGRTVALRGDFERRARAQLAQLQAAGNTQ
jgi:anti-sigma factor RsiW